MRLMVLNMLEIGLLIILKDREYKHIQMDLCIKDCSQKEKNMGKELSHGKMAKFFKVIFKMDK